MSCTLSRNFLNLQNPRIAIIGAGIAGLACATSLVSAGLDVQVFEKSRGVSGRMSTRRGEDWQCDHGAQYFTARDPEFRTEVQRWIDAGAAALWTPRMRVFDSTGEHAHSASVERFVGTPGMTAPGRLLAEGVSVRTDVCITRLQRAESRWQLSDENDVVHGDFDAVLLAVPAPQAQALLARASPALAAQAGSVRMRPSWALMLQYDTPLPLPFDAAFVNTGLLRWVARDSSKPGRGPGEVWLLHANALWSEQMLERDREKIAEHMQDAFVALGGIRASRTTLHRWLYADSERTLGEPCVWNEESALGLCGDWLHEDKIEGAWRSGRALAARVLGVQAVGNSRLECRRIAFDSPDYEQALQLREAVLRAPLGLVLSQQDLRGEQEQWHFGLYDARDALLACIVAVPMGAQMFKLRQMAVRSDLQGRGLGAHLMAEVERVLRAQGATSIILHARVSAATFYQKLGYEVQGEDFEEVGIPHRKMSKGLA